MQGVVDADTHIAEPAAMWKLIDEKMAPRRPVLVGLPEDTWFGERNALWLIDGNNFSKPAGKGSYRLVTPSAQKAERVRGDIAIASREVADVKARVKDKDRLGVDVQVIYPTLFLVYITDDSELDTALSKAYNSWLADGCAKSNGRLKFVKVSILAGRVWILPPFVISTEGRNLVFSERHLSNQPYGKMGMGGTSTPKRIESSFDEA